MDRMLYVAMTGARELMIAQAAISNNLANVSTPGFKADFAQQRAMPLFGEGYDSRVFAMTERPATDFAQGPLQTTGRELDLAISGDGWMAVQAPDGSEAYTRAGDLRLSPLGLLVTGAGHPVIGDGGPITVPPAEKIEIGNDGTISLRPLGQSAEALVVLDRIKLVRPDVTSLEKGEDGLIRIKDGGGPAEADAQVRLVSGTLEHSNVNMVDALVDMIDNARRYELQVKLMRTSEEDDAAASQLLRLEG